MGNHLDEQIEHHFRQGTSDWTPVSAAHITRLIYMPISYDSEVSGLCARVLSAAEVQRSSRFRNEADRDHFIQRRAFRRYCAALAIDSQEPLASFEFSETGKGRPFLVGFPALSFSFSSCRQGFLGAWSSSHHIGVDIEDIGRQVDFASLACQYFSATEASLVTGMQGREQNSTFYRYWTLKEAALKCIGEGLPFGLDAFEFELSPDLQLVTTPIDQGGPANFSTYVIDGNECCAALVTSNSNA